MIEKKGAGKKSRFRSGSPEQVEKVEGGWPRRIWRNRKVAALEAELARLKENHRRERKPPEAKSCRGSTKVSGLLSKNDPMFEKKGDALWAEKYRESTRPKPPTTSQGVG